MVTKSPQKKDETAAPAIDWSNVSDMNSALALMETVVEAADVLGDGAEFITDKNLLVGSQFLVLDWRFVTDEKTGNEYVNVHIMGVNGQRARFNDGGAGVYAQLKKVYEEMGVVGIKVKNGLRRSDYTYTASDGSKSAATTYYLATS